MGFITDIIQLIVRSDPDNDLIVRYLIEQTEKHSITWCCESLRFHRRYDYSDYVNSPGFWTICSSIGVGGRFKIRFDYQLTDIAEVIVTSPEAPTDYIPAWRIDKQLRRRLYELTRDVIEIPLTAKEQALQFIKKEATDQESKAVVNIDIPKVW